MSSPVYWHLGVVDGTPDWQVGRMEMDLETAREASRRLIDMRDTTSWTPPVIHFARRPVSDYASTGYWGEVFSQKARDVIDGYRGDLDRYCWLQVNVVVAGGTPVAFWMLFFPKRPDVFSFRHSVFVRNDIYSPALLLSRLDGHDIFSYWNKSSRGILMSDRIRQALHTAGCTGMDYDPVRVVDHPLTWYDGPRMQLIVRRLRQLIGCGSWP